MGFPQRVWMQIRVPVAALLAIIVVIAGIYLWLTIGSSQSPDQNASQGPVTDQQKLNIIASLEASNSPSDIQKEKVLAQFSNAGTTTSDQEKLQVLSSLEQR